MKEVHADTIRAVVEKLFIDANCDLPEEVLKQFHFGNSEVLLLAKDSPPEKAHIFETSQFNS